MTYKCKLCPYKVTGGWQLGQLSFESHFKEEHLKDFVETIQPKPKKLWTCPRCKEKFSYHLKYFHQQNAKTKCLALP